MATGAAAKQRKKRTGFDMKKDILLLRTALQQNPWQEGDTKWGDVVEILEKDFQFKVEIRTAKNRVDLLLQKYKSQELKSSTGTEEQKTERGSLLEEIRIIQEEEKTKILVQTGAESQDEELLDPEADVPQLNKKAITATNKKERMEADKERDELLNSEVPSPISLRRKRKLSLEDEMIQRRQDHEMEMDKQRLDIEREKLLLEEKREERLKEEGKRRDELAASQVQMQSQLLQVLGKLLEK